jgi:hypothetical protein
MLHWQRPTLFLLPAYHPFHFIILACMPYCHGPAQAEQRAQWWYPCVRSDLKGPLPVISLTEVLIIRLIIRTFQLIFSVKIVFFSHNKSVNSVFQPAYQHSRTGREPWVTNPKF